MLLIWLIVIASALKQTLTNTLPSAQQPQQPLISQNCRQTKLDNHTILVQTQIKNLFIFVDAQDQHISKIIRQKGIHNHRLIQLLISFVKIKEGFDVIYVGAHVGIEILAIARYIKDRHEHNITMKSHTIIHAFEPNKLYYILLTKSLYLNNLQQYVNLYNAAVYNKKGYGELAVKNLDTGSAEVMYQVQRATLRKSDYKYNVDMVVIDQVLMAYEGKGKEEGKEQHKKRRIGMVYISANTMQIQVLLGMKNTIKKQTQINKNKMIIIFQWNFAKNVHKNVDGLIEMLELFQKNGYKLYQIQQIGEAKVDSKIQFREIVKFMKIVEIKEGLFVFLSEGQLERVRLNI